MTACTRTPYNLTTLTLTETQWGTIRTALLCLSADSSVAGNHAAAAHWMEAYKALKQAMED